MNEETRPVWFTQAFQDKLPPGWLEELDAETANHTPPQIDGDVAVDLNPSDTEDTMERDEKPVNWRKSPATKLPPLSGSAAKVHPC